MPFRLSARYGLASFMLEKALATLIHSDFTSHLAYVVYSAEPVLAAAASMAMEKYSIHVMELIKSEISFFSLEAGLGVK